MARYNVYADFEKAAKFIAKCEALFLQRSDDHIYICGDGHFIVKVDTFLYEYVFRTVSPRFIELKEDCKATAQGDKKKLPVINPGGFEIEKAIPKNLSDFMIAEFTGFSCENTDGKQLKIFSVGESLAYLRDEYYNNLKCFFTTDIYGKDWKSPVFSDPYLDKACLILPVNYHSNSKYEIVDAEKMSNRLTA